MAHEALKYNRRRVSGCNVGFANAALTTLFIFLNQVGFNYAYPQVEDLNHEI
jgi:hypothetical protein